MSLYDGARVTFVGDDASCLGDEGVVLSAAATCAHVRWATGSRRGSIDLVRNDDLVPFSQAHEDSFDSPVVAGINVSSVMAQRGSSGLLNALNKAGHLMSLSAYAEDAISYVVTRLRKDASIREVLSRLDPEDGDELVTAAAMAVLREALR